MVAVDYHLSGVRLARGQFQQLREGHAGIEENLAGVGELILATVQFLLKALWQGGERLRGYAYHLDSGQLFQAQ